MKKLFAAFLLVSSLVVSFSSNALPLGTSNILVSSDNMLFEYTPEGKIVQQIPIPPNLQDSMPLARDLIVTASGEVAIFNGTTDPELSLYDPQTEQWRSFKYPGWDVPVNFTFGGIAAYGDGIYVNDMLGGGQGIIRFGLDGQVQPFLDGNEYLDLTLGLDNKFYALVGSNRSIDVIDPVSMQVIRNITLDFSADVRGVAVNAIGEIYTVSYTGDLNKYDSNGLSMNTMPVPAGLYDIDINTQGHIIFQDRDDNVYLTTEEFIPPQIINLPVPTTAYTYVAFSKNDAIVSVPVNSPSTILVSSDNILFEYTAEGQVVQQIPIPINPAPYPKTEDLIVTASGEIAIFNGTVDPELSLYDPQTAKWRSFKFPGWDIPTNSTFAGIAAYGNGIYVTNMTGDGQGIIRFGLDGVAQRFLDGNEYIDLTLGLNGKFYALHLSSGLVDIIEPTSMQIINTIQLGDSSIRGVAVNANGEIYTVSSPGDLNKYDSNGALLNTMPTANPFMVDIDVDAQGRIVFQDRNNFVYLTNEQFELPQEIILPVSPTAFSFVAFSKNDALVKPNPNILISSDNKMFEYTPEGQFVSELPVPPVPESFAQARDLIVTKTGEIAFFNGTSDPELSIYNPFNAQWRSFKFPGWNTEDTRSTGGIAAFGDYVYVTDMWSGGSGIIRFIVNGTAQDGTAQRLMDNQDYVDLTIGLDGKLYALNVLGDMVDVIDPSTMQFIRNIQLDFANTNRGIAVNKAGEIYSVNWIGDLIKYDSHGVMMGPPLISIGINVYDININADGKIIFQDRDNNIYVTDEVGTNPVIFSPPVPGSALSFVAFANNDVFGSLVSSPAFVDSDNDGISDEWELQFGLNPQNPFDATIDFEGDGLNNLQEFTAGTDPWQSDSDNDGILDGDEVTFFGTDPTNNDTDGDGLLDGDEVYLYGSNPTNQDTDGDGLSDSYEVNNQLNPQDPGDAQIDFEGDGLNNLQEFTAGTDPWNPDSDSDGLLDGDEVNIHATDPKNSDSDGDTISDGYEVNNQLDPLSTADALLDKDGDGLTNLQEYQLGTSASVLDSDEDGINDGDEFNQGLNPADRDTDNDGIDDGKELVLGLNPLQRDSNLNGVIDGFEHGNIIRVSPQLDSTTTNYSPSSGASLSANGRYVVFVSENSSLVSNDTNGVMDVFWSDTLTGEVRRVSVSSSGEQGNNWSGRISNGFGIDISDDGRYVVFHSSASNLVANDTNNIDIFVHDTQTSTTSRVSVTSTGLQANSGSLFPSISGDGRYVVFDSSASNLLPGTDGNATYHNDVFVHDRQTGLTTLVSKNSDGVQGNSRSLNAVISGNGRFVAFHSYANNLVANDNNGVVHEYYGVDVFVHDLQTGITERVSVSTDGLEGDHFSETASISADGRFIAFHSLATTLDSNVPASYNVFLHDRMLKTTNRIVIDNFEGVAYNFRTFPEISSSGRYIALRASKSSGHDVFVYDRITGQTNLVSRNNDGVSLQRTVGNNLSISDDGQFVGFSTSQLQLVPDKNGNVEDVFLAKTGFAAEFASAPFAVISSVDSDFIFTPIVFDASASTDPNNDPLIYQWDFGDGSFGAGVNFSHEYTASGNYTVTLTVIDGSNPPSIVTKVITVLSGAPTAVITSVDNDFIFTPITFDASLSIDPNGQPLLYQWDFGDGTFAAGPLVNHEYMATGSYTVTLTVMDGSNPPAIATKVVTVLAGEPIAQFTSTDSTFINTPEVFDASLTTDPNGDPLMFEWHFGDGQIANGINVTHAYALPGTYNVELLVGDGNNPLVSALKVVTVLAGEPVAQFTSADTVDKNSNIIFDASFSSDPNGDPLTFDWDFGDGSIASGVNVSHVYATSGTYTVILKVLDGNNPPVITTKVISVINQAPVAIITSIDSSNKNESILFDASLSTDSNGDALSYNWDFGDASLAATTAQVNYAYASSGTYTVTLTVSDSEASTIINKIITISNQSPVVSISGPNTVNRNEMLTLDASQTTDANGDALTYTWNFGDGATASGLNASIGQHVYDSSGNYTVTLTVDDGESTTTATKSITVYNQTPIAVITAAATVNKNESATYDASLTSDPNGDALTYTWDFGGGVTATGVTVNHTFTTSGNHMVLMTVSDGEISTNMSKLITVVNQTPIPVVTGPDIVNKNTLLTLDGSQSSDPNGDSLTHTWDFEDGTTKTGVSITHSFTIRGFHNVKLTVSDGESSSWVYKTIEVLNKAPNVILLSPESVDKNSNITFDASQTTDFDGDTLNYFWEFGDGNTAIGATATHAYATSGTFTVKLTVSDGESPTIVNKEITVLNQGPTAVISAPDTAFKKKAVNFDADLSTDPNGDLLTYVWDFGDGTPTATGDTTVHVYASSGTYTITLTVSDGESSSSTSKIITVVNQAPIAEINSSNAVNKNANASYGGQLSSDPDYDVLTYSWDFGDGTPVVTGTIVEHAYTSSGNFTVTLTVSDGELSDSASKNITVYNQVPVAVITAADSVNRNTTAVYDASLTTDDNGDDLTYSWIFGDGVTATGVSVHHSYAASGSYMVLLTVSDGEVSINMSKLVTVLNQAPIAKISSADTINKNTISVFDASLSSDSNNDVLSYSWNFGDGATAIGINANHTYSTTGTYTVTLTVNDGETSSSISKVVTVVNQAPIANAGADQTVLHKTVVTLDGSGSSDPDVGDSISYKWTQVSGRTVTLNNANNTFATFTAPRVKRNTQKELVFELEVTDEEGVTSIDTVLITVTR